MALDTQELIPALSPYRVGQGQFTAEIYHALSLVADTLQADTPGAELGALGKALLILHLFESRSGDLDKSGVSVLGQSWSKPGSVSTVKTSYWLLMEQMASAKAKTDRGTPLVERNDKVIAPLMRLDNASPIPSYDVDVDIYQGGES